MAIFRQYIAPLIVVLIFLASLVAVSARIFLPQDMAAPAPIEEPTSVVPTTLLNSDPALVGMSSLTLDTLIHGTTDPFAAPFIQ